MKFLNSSVKWISRALVFILFFFFSLDVNSQPLRLSLESEKEKSDDMVMQHGLVDLQLGSLKLQSSFLYTGEEAPYQGYLISFGDFVKIETMVESLSGSCDTTIEELTNNCQKDLTACNTRCNQRLASFEQENKNLNLRVESMTVELKHERNTKVIWAIVSFSAGVGLGVLIFSVVNE